MTNLKNTFQKTMIYLAGAATFAILYSSYQNITDSFLKDQINKLILDNKDLKTIINDLGTNNFIGEDWINFIKDFWINWNSMLSHLNLEQSITLANLMSAFFILLLIFSIITIIYSQFLLDYLKLETKYPKLGKILKVRAMFQQYYLIWNFILIIITLLTLIYVNYLAFTYYLN